MIEHVQDATLLAKAKDSIYHLALFGMTTPQIVDTKVVITAIIIGVGSAYMASYVNAERNSVKLEAAIARMEQASREQSDFRIEMRNVVTNRNAFEQLMTERVAILEATLRATHPNWPVQAGMQSTNGKNNHR